MNMKIRKLNDNELENVNGGMGMGRGVDDGAVRIVNAHCPNCCKSPDEVTRFEIVGTNPARCLRCNATSTLYRVDKA